MQSPTFETFNTLDETHVSVSRREVVMTLSTFDNPLIGAIYINVMATSGVCHQGFSDDQSQLLSQLFACLVSESDPRHIKSRQAQIPVLRASPSRDLFKFFVVESFFFVERPA